MSNVDVIIKNEYILYYFIMQSEEYVDFKILCTYALLLLLF